MKKPLIITLCSVLVLAIAVPVIFFKSVQYQCDQDKKAFVGEKQTVIDDINKIALLGESPAQSAEVYAYTRCGQLTGDTGISITKEYSMTMNGGAAVDAMRSSIANAGFTITSEYFGIDRGCKLDYNGKATKGNVEIGFSASQNSLKDPVCTNENSFYPVAENYFRQHNIDSARLSVYKS